MASETTKKRNTVISICKGIGIILMVAGHAEPPGLISNFIYTFHMPLFFICAGYFFSRRHLEEPWGFISKRIKGLYIPFVKWSIVFLLLHNLWFHLGILNEDYGNWSGGVTHPYTLQSAMKRLVMIFTGMAGYDEFMAGAFWFFRGLLIASIGFLLLNIAIEKYTPLRRHWAVIAICLLAVGFTALRLEHSIKITTIPNGGWRETWGVFFFGIGVLYRQFEPRIGHRLWLSSLLFIFLCFAAWMHFSGMNNGARTRDLLTLPLTGVAGFLLTHHVSAAIDRRESLLRRLLIFIGDNTLYVFIFHIISFKLVSLIKIWWYGLDFGQIGCHMVIHYNNHTDLFWLLYTVAGVAVPLLCLTAWRRASTAIASRRSAPAPTPGA